MANYEAATSSFPGFDDEILAVPLNIFGPLVGLDVDAGASDDTLPKNGKQGFLCSSAT